MNIKSLVVASAITGILTTTAFAETFDQCVERKKAELINQTHSFTVENKARCYSCKLCPLWEDPEEKSAQVAYVAPPGYTIVKNVQSINISALGRGFVSPVQYNMEANGRVYKVYVDLKCRSENIPFGAGAWQHRRLTGTIRKMGLSAADISSVRQACTR